MLPEFDPDGNLPSGVHRASWDEIRDRFGWTAHRTKLLEGVERVTRELQAAGCRAIWLDGSFVTAKEHPADFDLCYDLESTDIEKLDPSLRRLRDRTAMRERYGGDILPTGAGMSFLDFFQTDREGRPKGVVRIDLESLT